MVRTVATSVSTSSVLTTTILRLAILAAVVVLLLALIWYLSTNNTCKHVDSARESGLAFGKMTQFIQ